MKIWKTFFITIVTLLQWVHAEPLEPEVRELNAKAITTIGIHNEIDTVLVFPSDVTLVTGKGLTPTQKDGFVSFLQAEDARFIVLRLLKPDGIVLMTAVVDGVAYSFRLQHSDTPSSSIRFQKTENDPTAQELSEEDIRTARRQPTKQRVEQMIHLARNESFLREQIPGEYQGVQSRKLEVVTEERGYIIRLKGVARFVDEDTIILLGTIENTQQESQSLQREPFMVKVGETATYPANFRSSATLLKPNAPSPIAIVLIGNGRGRSLHLSLKNDFSITFAA